MKQLKLGLILNFQLILALLYKLGSSERDLSTKVLYATQTKTWLSKQSFLPACVFKNFLLTVKYQIAEIRPNFFKTALTPFEALFCDILNQNWYF